MMDRNAADYGTDTPEVATKKAKERHLNMAQQRSIALRDYTSFRANQFGEQLTAPRGKIY